MLLCAACSGSAVTTGDSSASCVGPYLDDQPPMGAFGGPLPTVSPGDTVSIHGHWYTETCNDTGGHEPLKPLPPVHLTVTFPDGEVQDLGPLYPHGPDMGFATKVHVPADAPPGTATVSDDRRYPAKYEFMIGS